MKVKRYYTDKEFVLNSKLTIDGEEYHHLKDVMRSSVSDEVVLFNGTGDDAFGVITDLNKNSGEVLINKIEKNQSEPSVDLTLFQAVCKGDKLSLITQKITELGANNLVVFYSKFTDIKDKTSRLDKLQKVSIAASKQCGRSKILNIDGVLNFNDMVKKAQNLDKAFVAYEGAEGRLSLHEALSKNANLKKIGVIIGAEGGFSPEEVENLEKQFEIVTLGKRILRTETAAIASVAEIIFSLDK